MMIDTLTFNSNLTKEDWDKLTDTEMDNTPRVLFKTPKGKEVVFINADKLLTIVAEKKAYASKSSSFTTDGYILALEHIEEIVAIMRGEEE